MNIQKMDLTITLTFPSNFNKWEIVFHCENMTHPPIPSSEWKLDSLFITDIGLF